MGYRGFGNPPTKHLTSQAPGQHGATRDDTHFDPREISFDVMILAPTLSDLKIAGRALSAALNPADGEGTLLIIDDDGEEYAISCIGNNDPTSSSMSVRTGTQQLVTVNLIAHDPLFSKYPARVIRFGVDTPIRFPFSLPWKFAPSTPRQTITNLGNMQTEAKITITGAIVNPVITRSYTDKYGVVVSESFSFTLTMVAGEVLTITTGFNNKKITLLHDDGTYDANPFQYLNTTPQFFQLVPGDNQLELTYVSMGADTAMAVEISDRYSGIYV
nr:phage tail domain-containing protein [uncultured Methanoregula sp.]